MAGADKAGPVADRAIKDLEALRTSLTRSLSQLLLRLDTEDGTDSLKRRQAQTQAAVYRQVVRVLEEQGVRKAQTVAGERAAQAVEAVVGKAGDLPTDVRDELDRIVKGQNDEVAKAFGEAADDIRRAINAGTTNGQSLAALTNAVAERVGVAVTKAQSAVDSAVMGAGRHAVVSVARQSAKTDGLDIKYKYIGPLDVKTRPFCRKVINKTFTEKQIEKMDNGQGLDVFTFCGGYNCRHSWAPVLD